MFKPLSWLNLAYALIASLLIFLTIYFGFNIHKHILHNQNPSLGLYLLTFTIIFSILITTIKLSLSHKTKRDISELYSLLPDLNKSKETQANNIERLSEEISNITLDKKQEINILIEKEEYRREFIGNVAHELKTPLFSIQGYLLTLIEGGVDDDSIRDKYLNRINKSVDRLTYIVKDLDLITDLESGNLKLELYPFNILALIQEVYDLLEIKAENNNISLKFDKNYDSPIRVIGDIEKIEQVLTNLITNAINHSKRKSTVTTSIKEDKNTIKIFIEDTGIGIKPDKLNRIFERFYRVEKSRSRHQGGSGLGLAIVKHILEAHNKKINVNSEYNKGTVFYFELDKA